MAKTKTTKRKHLKVAREGEKPTQETKEPTPREYVEEGLKFIEEAYRNFELAMACLNDPGAGEFYKTIKPDDLRKAKMKEIAGFVNQSGFGLTSLRDEVKIILGIAKAAEKSQIPAFEVPMPAAPADVVNGASEEKPTIKQLEEVAQLLDLNLTVVAEAEVRIFQYEMAGRVINFVKRMRDDAKARLEAAKSAA